VCRLPYCLPPADAAQFCELNALKRKKATPKNMFQENGCHLGRHRPKDRGSVGLPTFWDRLATIESLTLTLRVAK
jgi:hypothetical protein